MERRLKVELFEQMRREYEHGCGTIIGTAQKFGVHRRMVRQAVENALPPDRKKPERKRPKFKQVESFITEVLREDERATVIITTNLPFSEWTKVFPNTRLCKALLDRVTDRAHIIETGTDSYRFKRTVSERKVRNS